jgi:hypothetical protein
MSSSEELQKKKTVSSEDDNTNSETAIKKQKFDDEETGNNNVVIDKVGDVIKICKHILEKKKRRCKFNALRNLDYCVAHLAFNDQVTLLKILI